MKYAHEHRIFLDHLEEGALNGPIFLHSYLAIHHLQEPCSNPAVATLLTTLTWHFQDQTGLFWVLYRPTDENWEE